MVDLYLNIKFPFAWLAEGNFYIVIKDLIVDSIRLGIVLWMNLLHLSFLDRYPSVAYLQDI